MALITRISRLFQADMHSILDRIEEPEALLKQSAREMEEIINDNERNYNLLDLELKTCVQQITDIQDALEDLKDELDICFDADNEHLARALIKRRLQSHQYLKQLQLKKENTANQKAEIKKQLSEYQSQLQAIQQKIDIVTDIQYRDLSSPHLECVVNENDVEVAYLRELKKRKKQ